MRNIIGALSLATGGLLSIVIGAAIAARPYGDVALVRFLRSDSLSTYRPLDDLGPASAVATLCVIAGLLLALGTTGLSAGRVGRGAVALLAASAVSLVGGYLFGPFPFMPIGFVCLAAGNVGLGIAAIRRSLLSRATAFGLIAAGPLLFLFNTEDDRALVLVAVGLIWCWIALDRLRPGRSARVAGGASALVGGLLFLLATQADIAGAFAISALLFGLAAAEAYRARAAGSRFGRIGQHVALGAGAIATSGNVLAGVLPWEHPLAYAGWLVFVSGAVAVSAALLVLGVVTRTAIFIAIPLLPVIYFASTLGVKLAASWWISDPGLQTVGEIGAASTIGVGWIILGVSMARDAFSRAPSGERTAS